MLSRPFTRKSRAAVPQSRSFLSEASSGPSDLLFRAVGRKSDSSQNRPCIRLSLRTRGVSWEHTCDKLAKRSSHSCLLPVSRLPLAGVGSSAAALANVFPAEKRANHTPVLRSKDPPAGPGEKPAPLISVRTALRSSAFCALKDGRGLLTCSQKPCHRHSVLPSSPRGNLRHLLPAEDHSLQKDT